MRAGRGGGPRAGAEQLCRGPGQRGPGCVPAGVPLQGTTSAPSHQRAPALPVCPQHARTLTSHTPHSHSRVHPHVRTLTLTPTHPRTHIHPCTLTPHACPTCTPTRSPPHPHTHTHPHTHPHTSLVTHTCALSHTRSYPFTHTHTRRHPFPRMDGPVAPPSRDPGGQALRLWFVTPARRPGRRLKAIAGPEAVTHSIVTAGPALGLFSSSLQRRETEAQRR